MLMKKALSTAAVLFAASVLVAGFNANAGASSDTSPDEYGSFVIRNPTCNTLNYSIKWGDGSYKSYTVSAYSTKYHYYNLDSYGCVPSPTIRYDGVGLGWKTYDLDVYATDYPSSGKPYCFTYCSDGCCLRLYAD